MIFIYSENSPPSNINNGLVDNIYHSPLTNYPFIRIDLGAPYLISLIRLQTRTDCNCSIARFMAIKVRPGETATAPLHGSWQSVSEIACHWHDYPPSGGKKTWYIIIIMS